MANILAVDDNLELCKLIRTALERDGHRVETRQAGRDLTEALCRWADCILLDVRWSLFCRAQSRPAPILARSAPRCRPRCAINGM